MTVPVIVSLGDAALDVFVAPDADAVTGSDVPGAVRVLPGGSAANVAVWVARLGATAGFIGCVGDDYAGGFLRADLERENVTAHVIRLPSTTAAIAVLLDERGERTMIADRAAATLLAPDMILTQHLPAGCRLHLPAYSLFVEPLASAAMQAVAICRAVGGSVSVDTSSVAPLREYGRDRFLAALDRIAPDVLFANAAEATFLSGAVAAEEGSIYLQRFAPTVIWKLGPEGAFARGSGTAVVPGFRVPVLDTTGAGDAFAAAFSVGDMRGESLAGALDRANRLAAAVVQHIGARPRLALERVLE